MRPFRPATQRVLVDLVALPDTHVAIVSGRSARDARRLVNVKGVWVLGNHGIEVARPNAPPAVRRDVAQYASQIAAAVDRCLSIADATPGRHRRGQAVDAERALSTRRSEYRPRALGARRGHRATSSDFA